jgi:hypothetical protein
MPCVYDVIKVSSTLTVCNSAFFAQTRTEPQFFRELRRWKTARGYNQQKCEFKVHYWILPHSFFSKDYYRKRSTNPLYQALVEEVTADDVPLKKGSLFERSEQWKQSITKELQSGGLMSVIMFNEM